MKKIDLRVSVKVLEDGFVSVAKIVDDDGITWIFKNECLYALDTLLENVYVTCNPSYDFDGICSTSDFDVDPDDYFKCDNLDHALSILIEKGYLR